MPVMIIKHKCGGVINHLSNNLWECPECGEIKTGDEIKYDKSYVVVEK